MAVCRLCLKHIREVRPGLWFDDHSVFPQYCGNMSNNPHVPQGEAYDRISSELKKRLGFGQYSEAWPEDQVTGFVYMIWTYGRTTSRAETLTYSYKLLVSTEMFSSQHAEQEAVRFFVVGVKRMLAELQASFPQVTWIQFHTT